MAALAIVSPAAERRTNCFGAPGSMTSASSSQRISGLVDFARELRGFGALCASYWPRCELMLSFRISLCGTDAGRARRRPMETRRASHFCS